MVITDLACIEGSFVHVVEGSDIRLDDGNTKLTVIVDKFTLAALDEMHNRTLDDLHALQKKFADLQTELLRYKTIDDNFSAPKEANE